MMHTVFGAQGFIGSHIQEALQESGIPCYAPLRDDENILKNPLGTVFYCIGLTNDYKERPFDTVEAHVSFLSRVLAEADFTRLVYLSSTRLYDGLPETNEDIDLVLNPNNPRHLYDLSKALGENLCLTCSSGKASVVRLSSVYGDTPKAGGFLSLLLQRLKHERRFTLDTQSGLVRDYVHIDDVVNAVVKIADLAETGIINIASGENLSNQDIIDTLNAEGCDIKISHYSERQKLPICNIEKLKSIGIEPVLLRSYLKNFIRNMD